MTDTDDRCLVMDCEFHTAAPSNFCIPHQEAMADGNTFKMRDEKPANPRMPKVRIRKCSAVLRIPAIGGNTMAEVVIGCHLEAVGDHGKHGPHVETGYVKMADGTVRRYVIQWTDEGDGVIRERPRRGRSALSTSLSTPGVLEAAIAAATKAAPSA